jgi:hypothetical protein
MHQLCSLPYKQAYYNPRLSSRCLQEDCGLVADFASFPALLLKLLNLLVEQPSTYLGLLVLRADGSAVLEFAQNLEFKAMSLLSMRVEAVPQVGDGIGREQPHCTHGRRVGWLTLFPHFCRCEQQTPAKRRIVKAAARQPELQNMCNTGGRLCKRMCAVSLLSRKLTSAANVQCVLKAHGDSALN